MDGRIVVVGGGIAGLTAAFRLRQAGCDVVVIEAGDHLGGRMHTVHKDAYRIDVGASILMSSYLAMARLISDAGLTADVLPTSDLTGFRRDGVVHRFHNHAVREMVTTRLISPSAKLRAAPIAFDILRNRKLLGWAASPDCGRLDEQTVRDYIRKRTGSSELLDHVIDPVCAAMALVDPAELPAIDLLRYFRSVFTSKFFNFEAGVQELPERLGSHVTAVTGASATSVEEKPDGVVVTWTDAAGVEHCDQVDGCVLAVRAHEISALFPQLDDEHCDVLAAVQYSMGIGVHIGLRKKPREPGAFVCQSSVEDPDLHLAILDHNKAPGRAPEGHGLVSTYWRHDWGEKHWDETDEDVLEAALPAFTALFPGADSDITATHVHRWRHALVHSAPGRYSALTAFAKHTPTKSRVRFAGDWMSTSSTNAAIVTGEQAAHQLNMALSA